MGDLAAGIGELVPGRRYRDRGGQPRPGHQDPAPYEDRAHLLKAGEPGARLERASSFTRNRRLVALGERAHDRVQSAGLRLRTRREGVDRASERSAADRRSRWLGDVDGARRIPAPRPAAPRDPRIPAAELPLRELGAGTLAHGAGGSGDPSTRRPVQLALFERSRCAAQLLVAGRRWRDDPAVR